MSLRGVVEYFGWRFSIFVFHHSSMWHIDRLYDFMNSTLDILTEILRQRRIMIINGMICLLKQKNNSGDYQLQYPLEFVREPRFTPAGSFFLLG